RVAAGEPLPFTQDRIEPRGAAIEVRVYAEDPKSFLPSPGATTRLTLPSGAGIRAESGVGEGSVVSVHYDPLLCKLIAHGRERGPVGAGGGPRAAAQAVCVSLVGESHAARGGGHAGRRRRGARVRQTVQRAAPEADVAAHLRRRPALALALAWGVARRIPGRSGHSRRSHGGADARGAGRALGRARARPGELPRRAASQLPRARGPVPAAFRQGVHAAARAPAPSRDGPRHAPSERDRDHADDGERLATGDGPGARRLPPQRAGSPMI